MTEDEMVGRHHQLSGRGVEEAPGDSRGQGGLACCSSWDCTALDKNQQLSNNNSTVEYYIEVPEKWAAIHDNMEKSRKTYKETNKKATHKCVHTV